MSLREKRIGNAVPTSATAIAPATRYVVLSDDSSPTADTATTLEAGLRLYEGKAAVAGRREAGGADGGRGEMTEDEEEDKGAAEAMASLLLMVAVQCQFGGFVICGSGGGTGFDWGQRGRISTRQPPTSCWIGFCCFCG